MIQGKNMSIFLQKGMIRQLKQEDQNISPLTHVSHMEYDAAIRLNTCKQVDRREVVSPMDLLKLVKSSLMGHQEDS